MFLLVSGRHVGAHTDGHQHGVSIRISHKKNCCDQNFGESLCIFTFFYFPDCGLYLLTGFNFYFDLFWIAWHWKPAIYICIDSREPVSFLKPGPHKRRKHKHKHKRSLCASEDGCDIIISISIRISKLCDLYPYVAIVSNQDMLNWHKHTYAHVAADLTSA